LRKNKIGFENSRVHVLV